MSVAKNPLMYWKTKLHFEAISRLQTNIIYIRSPGCEDVERKGERRIGGTKKMTCKKARLHKQS
jgi:hypothetical protein